MADDSMNRSWPPIDAGVLFDAALQLAAQGGGHVHSWQELCPAHCSCGLPISMQQCETCGRLRVLSETEIFDAP